MTLVVVWACVASEMGCLWPLVAPAGVIVDVGLGVMTVGCDEVAVVVVGRGREGVAASWRWKASERSLK